MILSRLRDCIIYLKDIARLSSTDIDGPSQQMHAIAMACSTPHCLGVDFRLHLDTMCTVAAAEIGDDAAKQMASQVRGDMISCCISPALGKAHPQDPLL